MNYPRRLYRSADDRVISGVAGGLAAYLDVDPAIVRVIWFLSMFVTGSTTFWIYVIMMLVVPEAPSDWPAPSPWAPGGEPVGGDATGAPAPGPIPAAESGPSNGPAGAGAAPATGPSAAASGTSPAPAPGGWWSTDARWQSRQERWQRHAERSEYHAFGGPGIAVGLLLIVIGGMLAWHQIDPSFDVNLTWPVVVIALGVILVASSLRFRARS